MSPHVANFVHDLVAMAKAMEENPILQDQIEALKAQLGQAQNHNAGLEVNIISYKQQIDDLQAKVRSLEVERDDASFRTMEVEDKLNSTLVDLSSILRIGERIHTRLAPPEPEPVKEPEPVQAPTGEVLQPSHPFTPITGGESVGSQIEPSLPDATQGQSESPPIASLPQSEQPKEEQTASVTQLDTASAGSSPVEAEPIDPEPTPQYSYEWYQWNDRRNERAAI